MTEQRVSNDRVSELLTTDGLYVLGDAERKALAADLRDCRDADAVYDRAMTKAGKDICRLSSELATTQAALKDARAEIAAAERRGMVRAAEIADNEARVQAQGGRVFGSGAAETIAAAIRAALPPPSDAAPVASEVAS